MASGTDSEYRAALQEFKDFDVRKGSPTPSYRAISLLQSANSPKYGKYYDMAQEAKKIAEKYGRFDLF